jgi:hypothetical protein
LNPQELVPHVLDSLVQEVASQPEQVPELHVALAEFCVQSKQSAPSLPQNFASLTPGLHMPLLTQPVQQLPARQTPVTPPSPPGGVQPLLSATFT